MALGTGRSAPSISKSALLLSPCTYWTLPDAKHYNEELVVHAKRNAGTAFHKAADLQVRTGERGALSGDEQVDRWLAHSYVHLQTVLGPSCVQVLSELAVGINWLTGESALLPDVKDRGYPNLPGWQYGTADLVCTMKDGSLLVADWKTGSSEGAKEQLMSLGLAIKDHYPPGPVILQTLFVNESGVWVTEYNPTLDEWENHRDSMRFAWEDLHKKGKKHALGVHCTALYCPHLGHCSAVAGAIGQACLTDVSDGATESRTGAPRSFSGPAATREASMKNLEDMSPGERQAVMAACKRRIDYETEANKKLSRSGEVIRFGEWVWEDKGNGFRWHK